MNYLLCMGKHRVIFMQLQSNLDPEISCNVLIMCNTEYPPLEGVCHFLRHKLPLIIITAAVNIIIER